MRLQEIRNKMNELIHSAYVMGYEDGTNSNLTYERGLNDAWECARKIDNDYDLEQYLIDSIESKSYIERCDLFNQLSPQECMTKIKEYEEKQTVQTRKSVMTLDEAIKHCEEVAESKCDECGAEHRQLAEWLRELK